MTVKSDFYRQLSEYGCIVCRNKIIQRLPFSNNDIDKQLPYANVHHIQGGKRKWWFVIPLCPEHQKTFRELYGKEEKLFLQTMNGVYPDGKWPYEITKAYMEFKIGADK